MPVKGTALRSHQNILFPRMRSTGLPLALNIRCEIGENGLLTAASSKGTRVIVDLDLQADRGSGRSEESVCNILCLSLGI